MSAGRDLVRVPIRREMSAASAQPSGAHPAPSRQAIVALAIWTVMVSMATAIAVLHIDASRLQRALVMRPPVVVLNTMDWIQHAGTGDTPAERYANGAAMMHATIKQLNEHGALVLDASALHTYPDAVRLDAPTPGKSQ